MQNVTKKNPLKLGFRKQSHSLRFQKVGRYFSMGLDFWKIEFTPVEANITLLHSERPKLHAILAFLSAIGLKVDILFGRVSSFREANRNTQKSSPFEIWWENMVSIHF